MTRRPRAAVSLALASLLLGGCTEEKPLGLNVTFARPADRSASALVEVTVFTGTCAAPGGQVYRANVLLPSGTTSAGPMAVGGGPHAFRARAISADCNVIGEACVDRQLPTDEAAITIPIVGGGTPMSICAPTEECQGNGTCRRAVVPDGGVRCAGEGTDCEGGSGTCHGGECCFGCWDGTTCQAGTTGAACGSGGDACDACGPGNTCLGSLCVAQARASTFDLSTNAVFLKHESGVYYASSGNSTYQHTGTITAVPGGMPGLGGFTGSLRFADVAATQFSACGLTVGEGKLHCWGRNSFGLLGAGGDPMRMETAPIPVAPLESFLDLDGGDAHMCAIHQTGRLYCWGSNLDGQLGTGSVGGSQGAPVAVGGTQTWREVSALGAHTCAIRSDGALFCWGDNEYGQLGQTDLASSGVIRRVGVDADWIHVAAGVAHTCGIRGTGTTGGMYCWGRNQAGELGIGAMDMDPHPSPMQVGSSRSWASVTTGQYHTCGILDGEAYCWGAALWGELGRGDNMSIFSPQTPVVGGPGWTDLAASWQFTCGVRSGSFFCWGQSAVAGFAPDPPAVSSPLEMGLFPPPR